MSFPTNKKKIRNLSDDIDLNFYQPKKVLVIHGYTQTQLAEELGISLASVNGIINGNPSIAQIKVLADAIGCSFYEFFNFEPEYYFSTTLHTSNRVKCPTCGADLALVAL